MTDLIPISSADAIQNIAGQIGKRSRRIYEHDALAFATFLQEKGIGLVEIDYREIVAYRQHLQEHFKPATAKRMWSVMHRLLNEQVRAGHLKSNPADYIPGFRAEDESPHIALDIEQARQLLSVIDTNTKKGKRDYALLSLLLRTGIRRFECAALNIGDLDIERGHHVLTIEQGKGRKRRIAKIPVDVRRAIDEYLEATGRRGALEDVPLFVQFLKGDKPTQERISDKLIERTVKGYAKVIEIEKLTPHGLRTSFVTLALEGGASLQEVQYAAGHKDPRTTERYQRRKLNLDKNAVDFIHL